MQMDRQQLGPKASVFNGGSLPQKPQATLGVARNNFPWFFSRGMKRNNAKLKWALAGSAGVAVCVGALYKAVRKRIARKFDQHLQEVAIQTFEGEGGPALD